MNHWYAIVVRNVHTSNVWRWYCNSDSIEVCLSISPDRCKLFIDDGEAYAIVERIKSVYKYTSDDVKVVCLMSDTYV